jgi:hypothetical protein
MTWGPHAAKAGILLLIGIFGCGGDQRSGSASTADTTRAPGSDTSASAMDTTARAPDTSARATAPDTAVARGDTAARRDTASTVAARPTPKRPARPKPAATPAPASRPDTARSDTASTDASRAAVPSDTATPASQATQAPPRDPYHPAPLDTVSQQVYDGWKQFNLNCARCHGEDVQGTTIAPHLIVSLRPDGPINTKELFVQTVCAGRPAKGMPAWCPLGMEMSTIEAIYSYVKGRSDSKLHPGRPALRSGG